MCSMHAVHWCEETHAAVQRVFTVTGGAPAYVFSYVASPFWFAVARPGRDGDTIFNSSSGPLVFKVCCAMSSGRTFRIMYAWTQSREHKAAAQCPWPLCLRQLLSGANRWLEVLITQIHMEEIDTRLLLTCPEPRRTNTWRSARLWRRMRRCSAWARR